MLGAPIYPSAVYLTSYDAGRGQRFYIYGVTVPYADMVNFYKTMLKQKGDELFEAPPTHHSKPAVPRRVDGLCAERDDQGLHLRRLGGLSEPEEGRDAGTLPDDYPDRPSRASASAPSFARHAAAR